VWQLKRCLRFHGRFRLLADNWSGVAYCSDFVRVLRVGFVFPRITGTWSDRLIAELACEFGCEADFEVWRIIFLAFVVATPTFVIFEGEFSGAMAAYVLKVSFTCCFGVS